MQTFHHNLKLILLNGIVIVIGLDLQPCLMVQHTGAGDQKSDCTFCQVCTSLLYKSFENTVGKRRNCLLQAISPFPTVFSTDLNNFLPFSSNMKLSSESKFVVWERFKPVFARA